MGQLEERCKKAVERFGWDAPEIDDIRLFYRIWKQRQSPDSALLLNSSLETIGM